MESLIKEAWTVFGKVQDAAYIVKPSIPILFFGDSQRYFSSPLKVITVGLNPSAAEFPTEDPFKRFRHAQHISPGIRESQYFAGYRHALNDYFRCAPYKRWFNAFEPLLNGMGTSFYDGLTSTALHTDLCSPLATDPTWSGLAADARMQLAADGTPLWHRLVRHLAPDLILISVARRHLGTIDFPFLQEWETIYTIERTNPYYIEAQEIEVTAEKKTVLVFGQAANTPFGKISNAAKVEIGHRIGERARGR